MVDFLIRYGNRNNRLKSLDTAEFLAFFLKHFGQVVFDSIAWDDWINKAGYPPQVFNVTSEAITVTKAAADAFLSTGVLPEKTAWEAFSVKMKIIFL